MKKCISNPLLYKYLCELDARQFKVFYGILVHCRAHGNNFISTNNFFKLWCELNILCYETDRTFPCPYSDRKALKTYCHNHPYYFIDIFFSISAKLPDSNTSGTRQPRNSAGRVYTGGANKSS